MKESRFRQTLTALIDMIWVGVLWLLCSLPVITLGASTTALYYTVVKCVRHDRGSLHASFFHAFRLNFRQATLLWLLMLLYVLIGAGDLYAFRLMGVEPGDLLYYLSRLFFLPPVLLFPWLFSYLSRFENKTGEILKYSAYLALRHPGRTLLLALELVCFCVIVWLLPQLLPLLPGAFCLLMSLPLEPVFRQLTLGAAPPSADDWYND